MYRLIYAIPMYIGFLLLRTSLIMLGLVLIPPQALLYKIFTKEQLSIINGRVILNWRISLMWLWSNEEDGILAGDEFKGYPNAIRIIYWSAIRNPANNLRFVKFLSCLITPENVDYVGSKYFKTLDNFKIFNSSERLYDQDTFRFWSFTWCGVYSNLRFQFKMFNKIWRLWIGWKIYPHDKLGISDTNYRYYGAGFATQFKRIYPRD
jgi:hypothetical protein